MTRGYYDRPRRQLETQTAIDHGRILGRLALICAVCIATAGGAVWVGLTLNDSLQASASSLFRHP